MENHHLRWCWRLLSAYFFIRVANSTETVYNGFLDGIAHFRVSSLFRCVMMQIFLNMLNYGQNIMFKFGCDKEEQMWRSANLC